MNRALVTFAEKKGGGGQNMFGVSRGIMADFSPFSIKGVSRVWDGRGVKTVGQHA